MKEAEPPTTDPLAAKRARRRVVGCVLLSLAIFAPSLTQGFFYATLNLSAIWAMVYVNSRVR